MLSFNDVTCRRDGRPLFSEMSCVIHQGQKVGLTGANGCGKSSLFALIAGSLEPDTGTINLQNNVKLTHVAQETATTDQAAIDFLVDGDRALRSVEAKMNACQESDGERLASLLAEFDQLGGYSVKARAGAMLNGLGFPTVQHEWPVSQFSGGWRMRLNLGQALMSSNELLLLDEPTNHLDLDAVIWLENWLRQREGSLILISHDREFLDAITTTTLHIENERVSLVSGNYSAFERWRAARLSNQQALHEKTQARRKELQRFVDRFRAKATKARQAQSRLKMLERLGETQAVQVESAFSFRFHSPESTPSPLVVLQECHLAYGDIDVLTKVSLSIQSGDRIGLLGVNGAGKSTLVKALVGSLAPKKGDRTPAQKLSIGYFAQHQVDQLRDDRSPLETLLSQDPTLSDATARNVLGRFGFHGDQALQTAGTLSGGERARLALALIVQQKPNLLLLDEPTNHLDINMRQALADALVGFEGALLVISHDRTMLRSVVDTLWLVADKKVKPFDDDLDGYARWLNQQREAELRLNKDDNSSDTRQAQPGTGSDTSITASSSVNPRKQRKRESAELRARLAPLTKKVKQLEIQLEQAESVLSTVREKLSDPGLYEEHNKVTLSETIQQEAEAKNALERLEEALLDSMERLEEQRIGANE